MRNREGKALLATLESLPGDAPTACVGWTTHDVAAHLAAGGKEVADLIERKLEGRPDRPTRAFEEREAPLRAMGHEELIAVLAAESRRKLAAYEGLAASSDAEIAFTGTTLDVSKLAMHSRSESAIHRWDMVGSDDTSRELLSQSELTAHAVWVLNSMPGLQESAASIGGRARAAGHSNIDVTIRSAGMSDVVLHVRPSTAWLEMTSSPVDGDAVVVVPPDQRLLILWGRRPSEVQWLVEGNLEIATSLNAVLLPNAVSWPPISG